jgi:KDO2-lipid IV(A) lauroyltransferase
MQSAFALRANFSGEINMDMNDAKQIGGLETDAIAMGCRPQREYGRIRLASLFANTIVYQAFVFALSFLPMPLAMHTSRLAGKLRYRRRRKGVLPLQKKMASALQAEPEQAAAWLKRSFELAAQEDMESYVYPRLTKETVGKLIDIQGLDRLRLALAGGKGAILYSGHVRGWFTFLVALGFHGFVVHPVGRTMKDVHRPVESWFQERRNSFAEKKLNCTFLWMAKGQFGVAAKALNALKRNEIILVFLDPNEPTQGAKVNFFGRKTRMPPGPVLMAQASGAPLLGFYVHHDEDCMRQVAEIGEPFYASVDALGSLQHCASSLEEQIRNHPAHWVTWLVANAELWKDSTA